MISARGTLSSIGEAGNIGGFIDSILNFFTISGCFPKIGL